MAPNYALAYVNPSGQERFLLKGTTESGGQHVSKAEAKELSDELCFFASVDDIRRFLQQDSSVRPVDHAPYIFHFDPAKNRTFRWACQAQTARQKPLSLFFQFETVFPLQRFLTWQTA